MGFAPKDEALVIRSGTLNIKLKGIVSQFTTVTTDSFVLYFGGRKKKRAGRGSLKCMKPP